MGSSLIDLLFDRFYLFVTSRDEKGSMGGNIWKEECKYSVIFAAIVEENVSEVTCKQVGFLYRATRPSTLRTANWRDYLRRTSEFPGYLP